MDCHTAGLAVRDALRRREQDEREAAARRARCRDHQDAPAGRYCCSCAIAEMHERDARWVRIKFCDRD